MKNDKLLLYSVSSSYKYPSDLIYILHAKSEETETWRANVDYQAWLPTLGLNNHRLT